MQQAQKVRLEVQAVCSEWCSARGMRKDRRKVAGGRQAVLLSGCSEGRCSRFVADLLAIGRLGS